MIAYSRATRTRRYMPALMSPVHDIAKYRRINEVRSLRPLGVARRRQIRMLVALPIHSNYLITWESIVLAQPLLFPRIPA
jgi:hypothetical protein